MVTIEQVSELRGRIRVLADCVSLEDKRAEVEARQLKAQDAGFWDDPKSAEA